MLSYHMGSLLGPIAGGSLVYHGILSRGYSYWLFLSSGTCLVTTVLGMVSEKGRERGRERFGLLVNGALVFFGFVGCLVSDDTLTPCVVYSF